MVLIDAYKELFLIKAENELLLAAAEQIIAKTKKLRFMSDKSPKFDETARN